MRWLLAFLVSCGGSAAKSPPPLASHAPVAADDCHRACDVYKRCVPTYDEVECVDDCHAHLAPKHGDKRFADCMVELTCDAVAQSLAQDMGATGYCYVSGLR